MLCFTKVASSDLLCPANHSTGERLWALEYRQLRGFNHSLTLERLWADKSLSASVSSSAQ